MKMKKKRELNSGIIYYLRDKPDLGGWYGLTESGAASATDSIARQAATRTARCTKEIVEVQGALW